MHDEAQTEARCTIHVDGRPLEAIPGEPLIACLERHRIDLPHLCYHPQLGPLETCDTCWVQTDDGLTRGCTLQAGEGLAIELAPREADDARHEGIDRVIARHELYCSVCENNNGNCEVHNTVRDMRVPGQRYPYEAKPYAKDTSHPFYTYDPDQCILCGRCVEACQNLEVNETLTIDWERDHPRVLWDGGEVADQSSCVSCGQCVTVCPCNALMENDMLGRAGPLTAMPWDIKRPLTNAIKGLEPTTGFGPIFTLSELDSTQRHADIQRTKTVCTYCGVGCSFEMWTRGREILKIQPTEHGPANGVKTCIKGKFGWDFVNSEKRLTRPLIREGDHFREASWDEALDLVARRLGEVRDAHGPDALAFVASSKCTNEESYLTQKLARAVIGTNNVDNCSRYCQNPATTGLFRTVGYGGDSGSIQDLEMADLILMVGTNTAENHPVIASSLKRAQKHHGQQHIVADVRRHEMAERADLFLQPRNSTDLVWLCAVTRYLIDNGYADRDFIDAHVHGFEEYRRSLAPFTVAYAAEITRLSEAAIIEAAERIGRAERVCGVWAMGVTQHTYGSDTSTAISNLLLVTGNYGRPGTGGYPMRGHNNVQGASDFGSLCNIFPGYQSVEDAEAREHWRRGWGVDWLPEKAGFNNHSMINAVSEGKLRAMYIIGEESALVDANANHVRENFGRLDFMVVQDIFFSRTAEYADVVLPAAPSVEKEGTFVNTERRIQRLYQVMEPLGDARPDWAILADLGRRLGHPWHYAHPSEIMDEVAALSPLFAGVSYERLEGWKSLQWPVAADGTDTPRLYEDLEFHFDDGMARLHPLVWRDSPERIDDEYDLHLNNGRVLEHFHEGNLTGAGRINDKLAEVFVEVSPELARERGVETGSRVRLTSRRGEIELRVLVTERVVGHGLYVPLHTREGNVNRLTGDHADVAVETPAYKEIAVKMDVLQVDGPSPLPRNNHRNGRRIPIHDIGVERKWARSDYHRPPQASTDPERF
ncbi:MAG: formate dehydrogenase, alpha subunit [Halomonadaceae bacterium T82-2]|nr:MAG: formate dehydrogenase, alpha subunit [Halomonadaceae bacterium T82-2]